MLCLQVEWAAKTHDLLERLWKLPCSGQLGISLIPAVRLGTAPWPPVWRDVVFGCTGDCRHLEPNLREEEGPYEGSFDTSTITHTVQRWRHTRCGP